MKGWKLVVLLVVVALASSALTLGVQGLIKYMNGPGTIIIVSDHRCADCKTAMFEKSLHRIFADAKIKVVDYGDRLGKKLYKDEGLKKLPVILLPKKVKKSDAYKKIQRFAVEGKNYIKLKAGGKFDPTAEICDNGKDDNGDKLVDCKDPTCASNWKCMKKVDKPKVDMFVMSYCPFGTQIEKGILPVLDAIGSDIDFNVRFCDYSMHGKKELEENLKQHCIQKLDKIAYPKYLKCFLGSGKAKNNCVAKAKINAGAIATCIKKTDAKFGVMNGLKNKSKWKGRFPPFAVDAALNKKYSVGGSPTLVINGVVAKTGRSPDALLKAICKGFKTPPKACSKKLATANPSPGFGFKGNAGDKAAQASCGG